jgi:hypothetical protein
MATLEELEQRIAALEILLAPELAIPEECRARTCSYYAHYLIWYDPERQGVKLEHEAFHIAETNCLEAQKRVFDWYDLHPDQAAPSHLERLADIWERKVAA